MKNFFSILLISLSLISCEQRQTILHDVSGNAITIRQLQGKWIIINYWAAWCEGCVKEIPELNQFYADTLKQNIILLGVNYDHIPMPELATWVGKERIAYPVLVQDPAAFFKLTAVDVLPVTFIMNPRGKLVKTILGPNTEKSLLSTLHQLQKKDETTL